MKAVRSVFWMVVLVAISLPLFSLAESGEYILSNNTRERSNLKREEMMKNENLKIANPDDLVFYVQFYLKPEHVEEFKGSLLELVNEMAKEETFVSTFLHQDAEDTNKYTIYERWRESSMDDFVAKQLKGKEYRKYYEDHIEEWSTTTRAISVLKPLNQWISEKVEPSANDLAFYVNFHIKPEKIEEWKKAALQVLNSMTVEDTFVGAFLHQDANDPAKFTLYERWNEPNMEAFVKNQLEGKAYREVYEEQLPAMVASPRTFKVLKPVGNWINE